MSKPRSNRIPVWLTVGFAIGIGCGAMYFRREEKIAAPVAPAPVLEPDRKEIPRDAGSLAALEQTFQRWGGYAVWDNDVTELAAWDPRKRRHADYVEVRRHERKFYFRTIPALTRPLIDHGVRSVLPFVFTETQAMHDAFHRANPNYDRSAEPVVELPPKAPDFEDVMPPNESAPSKPPGRSEPPPRTPDGRR